MGTTKLNIGKIPISKGEYQDGTAYQRLNQVTMLGSTYQSKIDDNTSAPAQMGADGAVENINTDKWLCVAVGNVSAARRIVYNNETSGLQAENVQTAIDELGSKVSDLESNLQEVSDQTSRNATELEALFDDSEKADFEIADKEGNSIVSFKDGNIRTKYFDSSEVSLENGEIKTLNFDSSVVPSTEDGEGEFLEIVDKSGNVGFIIPKNTISVEEDAEVSDNISIEDTNGNPILQIKNGHIITRNFDSRDLDVLLCQHAITPEISSKENLIRDIPENRGVLNAYKKAQQLVNLKWTAISSVYDMFETSQTTYPRQMDSIAYSEVLNVDKYVGMNVSIYTFMTAAHNPYSLLYTEDLRKTGTVSGKQTPSSGYGFSYKNYDGDTYIGTYFGNVCNSFALWCVGIKANYYSFLFKWMSEVGKLEKVYDNTAQGVKLMDLLWEPGHVSIVTDIYRNDRGEVKKIFLSEHSGLIHTTEYTDVTFQNRMNNAGGVLYRYPELYKNLEYEPCVFSPVEGESFLPHVYNDDIVTFSGDKAPFVKGQIIYLNYNKGKYTEVEIVKDNEVFTTLPLSADANNHRINLTDLNLDYGMYKARLTNGSEHSEYTEFEVIDTFISQQPEGNEHKITFSSNKGKVEWISICTSNGRHKAVYDITDEDINRGYAQFDIRALSEAQRLTGTNPEALDKRDIADIELFAKVYVKGVYGTISSQLIPIKVN